MSRATVVGTSDEYDYRATARHECGDVVQIPDGRAGVVLSAAGVDIGQQVGLCLRRRYKLGKANGVAFAAGDTIAWDPVGKTAVASGTAGSFDAGLCVEDAGAAGADVLVDLNAQ